MPNMIMT